ncbi:cytochrome c biogenesis heme-transporting ATPase CcmA [Aliikangiella sp. G2MR2-5]|uniref:cytochrome c biogenesis heme-transporting ATPase CcmA n=1 Tax=Aliikangiella sp. G2MR2-5 TaxID=2788943 RepID=UPI0018AC4535|nr:cytochrome c biogenesis heme-transporting ATPase CcmA [Aliikangiella sp. G2MR2-5]
MSPVPISVLKVDKLGIRRSERWLFRDLSFELKSGEVIQVVGHNGAGKTSLMRSLCGLLTQAEGKINWLEINDLPCLPLFLGHLPAVKPELTVFENLKFHPIAGRFLDDEPIEDAIEEVRLGDYLETPARYLSAGQTRRVGLARLLLADTPCWVLDEPFTSLDVEGCRWLESQIEDFAAKGGAVLLTSHQAVNLKETIRTLEIVRFEEALC